MAKNKKVKPEDKVGSLVTTYFDPVIQEKPEEVAELVTYREDVSEGEDYILELWSVRFAGDKKLYPRKIKVDIESRLPIPGANYGEK